MSKPKPHEETHVIIKCKDCGKPREIRNQDVHQVERCKECQKTYRSERRRELRVNKGENESE